MTAKSLRPLALPEPGRDALKRTREILDTFLPKVMPSGEVWSLGGGTALAGDWTHQTGSRGIHHGGSTLRGGGPDLHDVPRPLADQGP